MNIQICVSRRHGGQFLVKCASGQSNLRLRLRHLAAICCEICREAEICSSVELEVRPTNGFEMGQRLERFFAGSPRPLRLFSVGFAVAALGVLLGFTIDYRPGNPLAYVAFWMGVCGWAIGAIAVAWGWYAFLRSSWRRGDRGA